MSEYITKANKNRIIQMKRYISIIKTKLSGLCQTYNLASYNRDFQTVGTRQEIIHCSM